MSNIICPYFPKCNACSDWTTAYQTQLDKKRENLELLLNACELSYENDIKIHSAGQHSLRHRADFSMRKDSNSKQFRMGFFDTERGLLDIDRCLQFAPQLNELYRLFRSAAPTDLPDNVLQKVSVRLRVGPGGECGCWLDLSNLDIKFLLEIPDYLQSLMAFGVHVELGQKGKTPVLTGERYKLSPPLRKPWFKISTRKVKTDLSCLVSEFTQPSWETASMLNQIVEDWLERFDNVENIIEFGSGIGQFTLQFLLLGKQVTALESDQSSCESLLLNAHACGVQDRLRIHQGDFHRLPFRQAGDLVFVNPSRAGLRGFTDSVLNSGARHLIYISCFPESMLADLREMKHEYKLIDLRIVDQFPQTSHYEVCALLEKI